MLGLPVYNWSSRGVTQGGPGNWTLNQGNPPYIAWQRHGSHLVVTGSVAVGGEIDVTFAPSGLQGFRVDGDVTSSFIAGGTVTLAGAFTQTGDITAHYAVSAVVGYRVDGEVIAIFTRRAGQLADCISGSGEGSTGNPPNAVH